jgi:hypothetical protein
MRLANFSERRNQLISRRSDEDIVFKRMCTSVGRDTLLNYMMTVCMSKYGLPMSSANFEIVFDGTFFTIQNNAKGSIIFIYGINGFHAPEFHIYQPEKKRVKVISYRFWEDQGLSRLLPPIVIATTVNVTAQTITKDPFSLIIRYLGIRDLLSCRIVCRQWRRNLASDHIWNNRIPCPIPGYTGLKALVICAALIQDFNVQWISDELLRIMLDNINKAWMHYYHLKSHLFPGVLFLPEEEGPKRRKVRQIVTAKQVIAGKNNSIRASKAGCLLVNDDNHASGATCWISPKTGNLHICKLKGTKPSETKIQRLHDIMFRWIDSI